MYLMRDKDTLVGNFSSFTYILVYVYLNDTVLLMKREI